MCCTGTNVKAHLPLLPSAVDREGNCQTVHGPKTEGQSLLMAQNHQQGTSLLKGLLPASQHAGASVAVPLHPKSTFEPQSGNLCTPAPQPGSKSDFHTHIHRAAADVVGAAGNPAVPSGSLPCQLVVSTSNPLLSDQRLDRLHNLTARISSILEAMGTDARPLEIWSGHIDTVDGTTKAEERHALIQTNHPTSREDGGELPAKLLHGVKGAMTCWSPDTSVGPDPAFPRFALQQGSSGVLHNHNPRNIADHQRASQCPTDCVAGVTTLFEGTTCTTRLAAVRDRTDDTCHGAACLGTAVAVPNGGVDVAQLDPEIGAGTTRAATGPRGPCSAPNGGCGRNGTHSGPACPSEDLRVSSPKRPSRSPVPVLDLKGLCKGRHSAGSHLGGTVPPVRLGKGPANKSDRKSLDKEDGVPGSRMSGLRHERMPDDTHSERRTRNRLTAAALITHGRVFVPAKSSYQERYKTVSRVLGAARGHPRMIGQTHRGRTGPGPLPRGSSFFNTQSARNASVQGSDTKGLSACVPARGLSHSRNVPPHAEAREQPSNPEPEPAEKPADTEVHVERPGRMTQYHPSTEGTAQQRGMRPACTHSRAYLRKAAMPGKSSHSCGHATAGAWQLQARRGGGTKSTARQAPVSAAVIDRQHPAKPCGQTGPRRHSDKDMLPWPNDAAQALTDTQRSARDVEPTCSCAESRPHGLPCPAQAPGMNVRKCERDGGACACGAEVRSLDQPRPASATWQPSCTTGDRGPRCRSHSPAAPRHLAGSQRPSSSDARWGPMGGPRGRSQSPTKWRPSSSLLAAEHQRWLRGSKVQPTPPRQVEVSCKQAQQFLRRASLPSLPSRGSYLDRVARESNPLWDPAYIPGVLLGPVNSPTGGPGPASGGPDAVLRMPMAQNLAPPAVTGGTATGLQARRSHERHVLVPIAATGGTTTSPDARRSHGHRATVPTSEPGSVTPTGPSAGDVRNSPPLWGFEDPLGVHMVGPQRAGPELETQDPPCDCNVEDCTQPSQGPEFPVGVPAAAAAGGKDCLKGAQSMQQAALPLTKARGSSVMPCQRSTSAGRICVTARPGPCVEVRGTRQGQKPDSILGQAGSQPADYRSMRSASLEGSKAVSSHTADACSMQVPGECKTCLWRRENKPASLLYRPAAIAYSCATFPGLSSVEETPPRRIITVT